MKQDTWQRRAAVEFVTIIVGVLAALAVNNAWQARADRISEREYLGAVIDEIRGNMTSVEGLVLTAGRAHDALEGSRRLRESGHLRDSASQFIAGLVGGVTFIPTPNVSRAAMQDLVSTGNIKLIRNAELRRTILETYSSMEATLERIERAQRSIAPGLDALVARYLPPNTVSRGAQPMSIEVSRLPQDQPAIQSAASQIASDVMFQRELNADSAASNELVSSRKLCATHCKPNLRNSRQ